MCVLLPPSHRQSGLPMPLSRPGIRPASGWGSAPDECWQEASLLLHIPQGEAIRLAARFGQNALYWVVEGELWLVPVLLKGAPCHLGRLTSRWMLRASV